MSWDPYIATLTTAGLHSATISGHTGQQWAQTPSFKLAPIELQTLSRILSQDSDAVKRALKRGFTIQGLPFTLNRLDYSDDETAFLIGRCKEHGAPATGVIVGRTAKTVIVGLHDPIYAQPGGFGKGYVAVFQLAESLVAMNF